MGFKGELLFFLNTLYTLFFVGEFKGGIFIPNAVCAQKISTPTNIYFLIKIAVSMSPIRLCPAAAGRQAAQ